MKTPKKKEVKEYFKDAETIKTAIKDVIVNKKGFYFSNNMFWHEDENGYKGIVWDSKEGYAKILSYKEPKEKTYKITREQIKQLKHNAFHENNQLVVADLKNWFPEVFETKLTVGKWYKSSNGVLKFFVTNEDAYGFNSNKEWIGLNSGHDLNDIDKSRVTFNFNWTEATTQEVTEALTKEAIRRGFKDGNYFIEPKNLKSFDGHERLCKGKVSLYLNDLNRLIMTGSSSLIYSHGVWAEIIPTITKQEAEAKLNCKII